MRTLNRVKHGLGILALAVSAQSAMAASDWRINQLGSGASDASTVSALDVGGVGYIQITPDAFPPGQYGFTEHGAYQAFAPNSASPFSGREITVTYSVSGTGFFNNPASLSMNSGRIDLYSDATGDYGTFAKNYGADNGTLIGSFNIVNGYVADANGKVVVNAVGIAGSFSEGYLFNSAGTDLAKLSNVTLQLGLYNQPILNPDEKIINGVVCGIANACGVGTAAAGQAFTVQDVGSVSISAVPEPATSAMFLVGLGLIGSIARRRR